MRIQPDEGISLRFGAKVPGPTTNVAQVDMHFSYAEAFGKSSANGYERLLLDAMLGDGTLFAHRDGVEATWSLFTPILEAWARRPERRLSQLRRRNLGPRSFSQAPRSRRPHLAQTLTTLITILTLSSFGSANHSFMVIRSLGGYAFRSCCFCSK